MKERPSTGRHARAVTCHRPWRGPHSTGMGTATLSTSRKVEDRSRPFHSQTFKRPVKSPVAFSSGWFGDADIYSCFSSSYPLRCVVWGAPGVWKPVLRTGFAIWWTTPPFAFLFSSVVSSLMSSLLLSLRVDQSDRWLTPSCLVLSSVSGPLVMFWSQPPFHVGVFGLLSTSDVSESLSRREAYFLHCQTPSVVKHSIFLCATRKKKLPIKLWHSIDCEMNSNFRDVNVWTLGMSCN